MFKLFILNEITLLANTVLSLVLITFPHIWTKILFFKQIFKHLQQWPGEVTVVQSTCCSCRRPGFDCQRPREGSQLFWLQFQGISCYLLTSTDTRHECGTHAYMYAKHPYTYTHTVFSWTKNRRERGATEKSEASPGVGLPTLLTLTGNYSYIRFGETSGVDGVVLQ